MTPVVSSPRTSGSEGSYSRHFLHRIRPPSLRDFLDSDAGRRGPPKADYAARNKLGIPPNGAPAGFPGFNTKQGTFPPGPRRIVSPHVTRTAEAPAYTTSVSALPL